MDIFKGEVNGLHHNRPVKGYFVSMDDILHYDHCRTSKRVRSIRPGICLCKKHIP